MQKTVVQGVIGILAGLLLVWGAFFARPYTLRGSLIEPALPAPQISLNRVDGSPYLLSEAAGRVTLIFFGYTYCPDICPATLAEMKKVKADLGQSANLVDFVFITVDPDRDTPERMHLYATGFDADFIGLSGSQEELEPIWKAYYVVRSTQETESAAGYLVDHSTRIYLVDKAGNLRLTYAYGTPPTDIAADIRFLLKE